MSQARMRIGVIDLGYWGPNLLRVLAERDDVDLAWMCDLDADKLAKLGRRHPATRTTAAPTTSSRTTISTRS